MIMGVIFKNGVEIDRGIATGGKKWCEEYPEQYISICDECSSYHVDNERKYTHDKITYFQELQDNGNGWEVVYDSREKVDRTTEYPLPSWLFNSNLDIPNYNHRMVDGDIENEFKGYVLADKYPFNI